LNYLRFITISLITILFLISCGGEERQAREDKGSNMANDSLDPNRRADMQRYEELGYTPKPPAEWDRGPTYPIDSVLPGTCAAAAAKFAQAFAHVDSSAAFEIANDTMDLVVRSIMTNSGQVMQMRRMIEQGFHIVSVAEKTNPEDSTICHACVTANLKGSDVEDCSFKLHLYPDGEWLLYDFGKTGSAPPAPPGQ